MKKPFVLGCLAVLALLIAGGGFVGYRVAQPYISTVLAVRELGKLEALEANVRNKSAFRAPADGVLSEEQVSRYMNATGSMLDTLKGRAQELAERYEEIERGERDMNLSDLAGAWSDVINLLITAKRTQVDALNATGFSLAEYGWVRQQVLDAAGLPVAHVNLANAVSGSGNAVMRGSITDVPEENRALVEQHKGTLEQIVPLAAFGL